MIMRKILLFVLFLSISFCGYSQLCFNECKLRFSGDNHDYIVKEFNGVDAERLYADAKNYIVSTFKSAKNVLSESGEILSINGVSNGDAYIKYMGTKLRLIIDYTLIVRVKDGKIRIDVPVINSIKTDTNPEQVVYVKKGSNSMRTFYVYKKNGDIRYKDFEPTVLDYFNKFINNLIAAIGSPDNDW